MWVRNGWGGRWSREEATIGFLPYALTMKGFLTPTEKSILDFHTPSHLRVLLYSVDGNAWQHWYRFLQ